MIPPTWRCKRTKRERIWNEDWCNTPGCHHPLTEEDRRASRRYCDFCQNNLSRAIEYTRKARGYSVHG